MVLQEMSKNTGREGVKITAEVLLTINEVADLESLNYSTIRKKVTNGKLQAVQLETSGGRRGYEYRIALDQLSEKAQRLYYARKKEAANTPLCEEKPLGKKTELSLLDLTEKQRTEVDFWLGVIKGYNLFIADQYKNTTAKTKEYIALLKEMHPDRAISERTLRRKLKDYRELGEVGLADFRLQNKAKGTSVIDEIAWSAFLQYWLDEARPTVTGCYRLVSDFLRLAGKEKAELLELLPLPDVQSFYRLTKQIPYSVVRFYRFADKTYADECEPYLERDYEGLSSNEVWTADYHTLDFFVRDDITGKIFRPYLMAWMDIRSRKILAISLTGSANSDGNFIAFRKAVSRHGIPGSVYLDNGREFLVSDFGGRGRRKTDTKANYGLTILQRLGIIMHNSQVKNAKAKAIERFFGEICKNFSKFVNTYCGGKPENRPERLSEILKTSNNVPLLSEVTQWIENYIEGYYNEQPSNAKGLKGLTPNKCWENNLTFKKTATKEHLDLMLLRSARLQEVRRNGVYINIGGEKVHFYNTELVTTYMKHRVYVRYNPEDLKVVHIYDDQERYICEAEIVTKGDYSFGDNEKTTEAIKDLNRKKKQQKKIINSYMELHKNNIKVIPAMEVIQAVAQERLSTQKEPDNYVIQPIKFTGKLDKAVGFDEDLDRSTMLSNMVNNVSKLRGGDR